MNPAAPVDTTPTNTGLIKPSPAQLAVARNLIRLAAEAGVFFFLNGDGVGFRSKTPLTPELRAWLKFNRHGLLAVLRAEASISVQAIPEPTASNGGGHPPERNPFRGPCTLNPQRQPVVDLLAEVWDSDPPHSQKLALDLAASWKERMAICRADGGCTDDEAEAIAWDELRAAVDRLPLNSSLQAQSLRAPPGTGFRY